MVFNPTHTRLTRTSSDLRTLSAALLPPSPILKADELLISSTSGEIPILLEATTHIYNSEPVLPTLDEPLGLRGVAKEFKPIDRFYTTTGNTPARSNEPMLENRMYGKSEGTCILPDFPDECYVESPSNSCPARVISNGAMDPTCDNVLGGEAGGSSTPNNRSQPILVIRSRFGELRDPQASYPGTMEVDTTTAEPKEDLDGDQSLTVATFQTYSTLPTPTFAPPSPSSSADVISSSFSLAGQRRHRRPLERARAVRFPGRPRSLRLQVNEVEPSLAHNTPLSTKHASNPRRQLTDYAPPASTFSCTTNTRTSDAAHPFMKHVALPEELSWIKHVSIELWIDQEGFRAVRPCMQLMGYSPRTRSLHPYGSAENVESGITAGVAEFMPLKRETFAFHYATLDSPPTLRMVSVAGDESRDYISRQATLSVKANGVYTVLGTETFIASTQNSDAHGLRLAWKFDYLVGDRNVDGTGKTLPGEKTLTPLTFSCSPYLLHPLQGKKAGLMHIMKKNLVPKLGSQKVEPPTYLSSQSISPQTSRHLLTGRGAAIHSRSRSDASAKSGHYHPLTRSPLDTGVQRGGAILGVNHMPCTRRRRASSAGENSLIRLRNEPGGIVALKDPGMLMPGTILFQ